MQHIHFPLLSSKVAGDTARFDLTDAAQRQAYFEHKAGEEIKRLRAYLEQGTFIVYLLGKKSSGKGTYAKMVKEIVAPDKIEHLSVGDMVRSFDGVLKDEVKKQELIAFLREKYRGPVSVDRVIEEMEGRSTKSLLPSELILALAEREISRLGRKAIFIDGFPRDLDQVSYSLFFKHLIDYRNDPDIFALIDVPSAVIDERIKYRVVCPLCQTSRNTKLLPTKQVGYDGGNNSFYLVCDNPACKGACMVPKEGDHLGIEPIRSRLKKDGQLMEKVHQMHGITTILLRNSVPVSQAPRLFDDYEITPEYFYTHDPVTGAVATRQKPWEITDDEGVRANSLTPPPVVVRLIKELVRVLGI